MAETESSEDLHQENHFIVGLGASAGGLEALEAFFSNMPVDTGLSFVVIQHLAPDFKSLMDELLARHTTMAIHKSENNMVIEPDSIYLIPPKKEMIIKQGKLILRDRKPSSVDLNLPIDIFFQSLAEERKTYAIGIVFSGTGSDGSRGIAAIHENGGLVICQSPESAKFDGMPNSAIATALVDVVVNPNEMAEIVVQYINHSNTLPEGERLKSIGVDHDIYSLIFAKLKDVYDVDFQYYKPATIGRRIERRMTLARKLTVDQYVDYLNSNSKEVELLYRDLLIGVTQFFRDDEIWFYLEQEVISRVCEPCSNDNEIRFWVPACATGEEAYSLAILIHEYLIKNNKPLNVRVFATDLHKDSLAIAGKARYPHTSVSNISYDRLQKYFSKGEDGFFEVNSEIRRMVVFANHNVLKDPPFTKIDFISCRNLLIYFMGHAQKRVLNLFHFALKVNGVLFLGPSESLGDIKNEFEELHRRFKIYKKRRDIKLSENFRGLSPKLPMTSGNIVMKEPFSRHGNVAGRDINLIRAYDRLLQRFVPPSLLIENNGTLAHTFGDATEYLRTPTGVSSLNILDVIHPDLRMAVSTGLQRAAKDIKPLSYGGIKVTINDQDIRIVRITMSPISEQRPSDYLLITIEENKKVVEFNNGSSYVTKEEPSVQDLQADHKDLSNEHVRQLEEELRYTKENLQATVEELETSNEELQATNEELMASNEELQSTNEELHSVNEELYTVNREYEEKIQELTQLTDDMDNLLASTDIGTIFLDKNLKIRKFTPAAARQFSLISQDIGRPISHLNRNIEFDDFHNELHKVTQTGEPSQFEVRNVDNRWYLMGLHPYRNEANETTGVVITFVEISTLKEVSQQITQRNEDLQSFAYAISHDLNQPVRILTKFSDLLIEETGPHENNDENIEPLIRQIKESSEQLKEMLSGTLKFSRIITQGDALVETPLISCLDNAKQELKEQINASNANIICENLPAIQCDGKQMTRVFLELISNSLKFKRKEIDPEIHINYQNVDPDLKIFYQDNGIGLESTNTDRYFHIFYTGLDKSRYTGMGLGLAICKRIVERHNGSIKLNVKDEGCEFILSLPFRQTYSQD